ncbi:MAG: 30S ribosomal protein S2 [Patescibacteria group bacterium]
MSKKQISVEGMMEAGMHYGHQTFRRNPKMDEYIFDAKSGVHIIDLTKTQPLFEEAIKFVNELTASGKQIVFVGSKRQAKPLIEKYAGECGMPYVADRWLGGLLTNYETIKKRLKYLRELDEKYEKNDFSDITKKEKVNLDAEYAKLQITLGGLRNLKGIPGAIFVVDVNKDQIAIREAKKLGLPVVAIVDTNVNPDDVDYPIPANDDARRAIEYVLEQIATNCNKVGDETAKPKAVKEVKEVKEEVEETNGN